MQVMTIIIQVITVRYIRNITRILNAYASKGQVQPGLRHLQHLLYITYKNNKGVFFEKKNKTFCIHISHFLKKKVPHHCVCFFLSLHTERLFIVGTKMQCTIEKDQTPATVIQDCGPVVLFARDYPQTVQALRAISGFWHELETILFAFSHIHDIVVPGGALSDCIHVWWDFKGLNCDVDKYMKDHVDYMVCKLTLTLRVVLRDAIRTFIITCVGALSHPKDLRFNADAARSGNTCRRMGCVCMLIGNSVFNIDTTTLSDVRDLLQTKARLTLPVQQRNKRQRDVIDDDEALHDMPPTLVDIARRLEDTNDALNKQ